MDSTSRIHVVVKGNSALNWFALGTQSVFLLLVRLYWGWMFMQVGWSKLTNLGPVIQMFTKLGIPAPGLTALVVGCVECFGGVLLALGFLSRLTALVLTFNMTMAYWFAHRAALFSVISDPKTFYGAPEFTFLFAVLLVLLFGPGWIALDRWIVRMFGASAEQERPVSPPASKAA